MSVCPVLRRLCSGAMKVQTPTLAMQGWKSSSCILGVPSTNRPPTALGVSPQCARVPISLPGVMEYIQEMRETLHDLQRRVQTAKLNLQSITQLMEVTSAGTSQASFWDCPFPGPAEQPRSLLPAGLFSHSLVWKKGQQGNRAPGPRRQRKRHNSAPCPHREHGREDPGHGEGGTWSWSPARLTGA